MHRHTLTSRFLLQHLIWPLLVFVLAAFAVEYFHVDLVLDDLLYSQMGQDWIFKDSWLTHDVIHNGGRKLVGVTVFSVFLLLCCSYLFKGLRTWRYGLLFLLSSALIAGGVITVLKRFTHVDCPWDLMRYGGNEIYVSIFDHLPALKRPGACFPAGHSSAAWAWFGFYFLAREYARNWQRFAFIAVTGLGMVFGISQEIRGAHFISHDLWTLSLCWLFATLTYMAFYCRLPQRQTGLSINSLETSL